MNKLLNLLDNLMTFFGALFPFLLIALLWTENVLVFKILGTDLILTLFFYSLWKLLKKSYDG